MFLPFLFSVLHHLRQVASSFEDNGAGGSVKEGVVLGADLREFVDRIEPRVILWMSVR